MPSARSVLVEPLDEAVDDLGRTAHEQRLVADQPRGTATPSLSRKSTRSGGASTGNGAADRAQRLAAAEGEQVGVARTESDDAKHGVSAFAGPGV